MKIFVAGSFNVSRYADLCTNVTSTGSFSPAS